MEVSLETKFKRYLLYGSDGVVYLPGCRLQHKFYQGDNLEMFRSLLNQLDKELVLQLIKWFHTENLSPHPEVLPFVLSECCRNTEWREDALKLVDEICTTSEYFLLFFKFGFEVQPKLGTGRAVRRLINNWYSGKDCLDLARMVGEPRYRGWGHGDLIKLGHLKSKDPSRSAIYDFATSGYERMVAKYGESEEAKTIVDYLSEVYHFRRETDIDQAIIKVESYMLDVKHVNHIHIKSKKIWRALIPQIDLKDLIKRLHLLSKYGMFRASHIRSWDPEFIPHICDRMLSYGSVVDSGIAPSSVCLELCRYQNEPSQKLKTAIKEHTIKKRVPQISRELVQSLESLMASAFVNIKPNGLLNYTVMIDTFKIESRRCAYRGYVSPNIAAAVIALSLRKSGANVNILKFENGMVHPLNEPDYTVASLSTAITGITPGKPNARAIINYLTMINPPTMDTDVFVLLGNTLKCAKYKKIINTHNSKNERKPQFVFCSLCGLNFAGTIEDNANILVTSGFDDKLFHLINSFGKIKP